MAELLMATFLGFFCDDDGSTPVLERRTKTSMTDTFITEMEVRRAPDCLYPRTDAGHQGLFPKYLSSHIGPVLV